MSFTAKLIKGRSCRVGRRAQRGAAAVEFALTAPFFMFLICVAFDLGLTLFTQTVLDNAAHDAARLIETNQTGGTSSTFTTRLCDDMGSLVSCGDLQYYVQSAGSFASMGAGVHTNGSGNLTSNGVFSPGSPGQDVVVQVAYNRPTLIPWVIQYLNGTSSTISKASTLLVSTIVFQNEP